MEETSSPSSTSSVSNSFSISMNKSETIQNDTITTKKGRPLHSIWSIFTEKKNSHLISQGTKSICKHCNTMVLHHNKTICVERHLKKCKPFLSHMNSIVEKDQPEWFKQSRSNNKKSNFLFQISKPTIPLIPIVIIKLNVGGTYFETSKSTLLQYENSYFHDIIDTDISKDENGVYFLDIDPKTFSYIMDYLRYSELSLQGLNGYERRKLYKTMEFLKLKIPTSWDPFTECGQ